MESSQSHGRDPDVKVVPPGMVELIDPTYDGPQFRPPHRPVRHRWRMPILLFVATCLSTVFVGTAMGEKLSILNGLIYGGAVMSILLAHEMGHYLQAVRYGVPASPPYFVPMPFTPIGTMGAVIFQGAGVADRKQMFDIAISGPLAGLVLALPITYFGLLNASIEYVLPNQSGIIFGDPLLLRWMAECIHGPIGPNQEVILTPLLFAGWVGIFITALNLIPIGQLDGGHILYTLIGKRAHNVAVALLFGAIGYMIFTSSPAYILMIILLFLMGPRHPPTRDDTVPLGRFRIILGWLTLAFIIIGFTPNPIVLGPN